MKTRLAALLLLLAASPALAQQVDGEWQGVLHAGPAELRLVLHLTGDAATGYRATLDSPDQNVMAIPVEAVSLEGGRLTFTVPQVGGTFEGTLHESGQSIAGLWTQGAASLPLEFVRRPAGVQEPVRIPRPGEMDGSWGGVLTVQGQPLDIVVRIVTYEDGLGGTLDIPAQGARGLPISRLSREGDGIRLEMRQLALTYEGTLSADGNAIAGTWRQPGFETPLELRRSAAAGQQP